MVMLSLTSRRRPTFSPRELRLGVAAVTAGVLVVGALAQAGPAAAVADPTTPTATSAYSLIDSVGVNVHMSYNDTSYADATRVQTLLQNLGVRNVRDGLVAGRPDQVAALQQLGQAGIRSSLIVGGTSSMGIDQGQISELSQLSGYTDMIEPTNEADCSGDASWAADLHTYANALVQTMQSSDQLRRLGLLAPAFCRPESVAAYGSVQGSAAILNAHDYSGGAAPELALEGRLPGFAATQGGGLPSVVTETGFHNALNAPAYSPGVTEATAADYTLRTLLDDNRLGIARTYLYELMDEKPDTGLTDPEEHFGLVRADGTVKPAYTAVQNLLSDVALGSPSSVSPSSATATPVSIRGGGSLLRSSVITDPSGGGQTVALWLATPLENTTTHARLANPSRSVRLTVPSTFTATSRQPSQDNSSASLGSGTTFDVPVNGAVTLVHLAPGGATTTAATCPTAGDYTGVAQQLGATTGSDLAAATGWTGTPSTASAPVATPTATAVTAAGQRRHIAVAGSPSRWTVAVWEKTDSASASASTFLAVNGTVGTQLRTYDLSGDAPSRMQLSGYGAPSGSSGWGTEMWGQALTGTWHLLTLTDDGVSSTFAVDGVVQGTSSASTLALTALDVGSVSDGYRGSLAGLQVFPRALTAAEQLQLATVDAGPCGTYTPPTGTASAAAATQPSAATTKAATATTPTATTPTATTPTAAPATTTKTAAPAPKAATFGVGPAELLSVLGH